MVEQAIRKSEVLALLREHKLAMAERFGVVDLALFGSTVRDEAGPDSDVDILVSFDRPTQTATSASSSTSRTCLAGPSTSSRTRHYAPSCARTSRPRRFVSEGSGCDSLQPRRVTGLQPSRFARSSSGNPGQT